MKIFALTDGNVQALPSLYQALHLDEQTKTIAFVGGGGKTTLLYALAEELQRHGCCRRDDDDGYAAAKEFFCGGEIRCVCRGQLENQSLLWAAVR